MDRDLHKQDDNTYFLDKGYVYFSKAPVKIHAVLGSAVAVCLWDRKRCFGGMNHFTHPTAEDSQKATPRFGNAAMVALFRVMERAGSANRDIVAQVFGGGTPDSAEIDDEPIGEQNVAVARTMLKQKGIKVVSEDVGGSLGRKIVFDVSSGSVAVLKVENIRRSDWTYQ